MAETETTVTPFRPKPKDPTGPLRSRRARQKRKAQAVTAPARLPAEPVLSTAEKPNEIKPTDTPARHAAHACTPGIVIVSYIAALALAAVSAGFSITGLTSIFIGAYWPVIGMGIALEVGKLSAVAFLGHHSGVASWPLRTALGVLVAVLMGLNAIGAYGFLAKAHIGHAIDGDVAVAGKVADVDSRISVQAGVLADLDRRLSQIDGAVEKATSKGRTAAAMALATDQRKARADLVAQRTAEAKALAGLKVERSALDGEKAKAEADLGPVKYLATLLGTGDQDVLRWFILVVALLLDPAAVLLLLAAASARR